MTNTPTVLQPALPAPAAPRSSAHLTLPADLRDQAVRRLAYVAVVFGVLFSVSLVAHTLAGLAGHVALPSLATTLVRLVGIACAGVMLAVAASRRVSFSTQVDVGLGFEILGAATLVGYEQALFPQLGLPLGPVSLVSLWILVFRLFIPSTATRALVAALITASMVPLSFYARRWLGLSTPDADLVSVQAKIAFGTAGVAWLAARALSRVGEAVSEARTLGRYQLEDRLGHGGMGEVWRASHARLKRPAAIKLIDPEVLGATDSQARRATLARFEREAQATAELSSPHTVTLYDYGAAEDGTLYYVMEYLDGLDLETLVQRHGPLPPERTTYLLGQVCDSLVEAHAKGLIHRDIKPANIFLCRVGGEQDFVKVLDFGLVKRSGAELEAEGLPRDAGLTRDDALTGTPAFMPPEMIMGEPGLDARTDLYMLGCTAYWLLTGRLVYEGRTPIAQMNQHVHGVPVPPSARAEMPVPAALEELVLQCLRKDPAERPASAEEVRQRLAQIDFATPWTGARASRWWEVTGGR